MEEHGHVVLIVGGIEAGDVDQAVAQAVAEVAGVQGGLPVVLQVDRLALCILVGDPLVGG